MDKIDSWILNRGGVTYDCEELSVLDLVGKTAVKTNEVVDKVTTLEDSNNKKVSHDEMNSIYKHEGSDFKGSWHGIEKPQFAEPGIAGVVDNLVSQMDDITNEITIKPSGNANIDVTNIKNAFAKYRNVNFENKPNKPFLINEVIEITPIDESTSNGSLNGRIIDFRNSTFLCSGNIDYCFVIKSNRFPFNLRHNTFKNIIFDGAVNKSFIKFLNGNSWFNKFENIRTTLNASAISLIALVNDDTQYQGGLNTFKQIYSFNNVQKTLEFIVESGCVNLFDDLIIEDISATFLGNDTPSENRGSCICLRSGAIISMSKIERLFFAGYGDIINGENNTTLYNSNLNILYAEPKSTQCMGVRGVVLNECDVKTIRLYLVSGKEITTYARTIYTICVNSTFNHLYINEGTNININTNVVEMLGNSKNNKFINVGEDNKGTIIYSTSDKTSLKTNIIDNAQLYKAYGNVLGIGSSGDYKIKDITSLDINSCDSIDIKIFGQTDISVNNNFSIMLGGKKMFEYNNISSGLPYNCEIKIVKNNDKLILLSKNNYDNKTSLYSYGSVFSTPISVTDLELKVNVLGASAIYIMSVEIIKNKINI